MANTPSPPSTPSPSPSSSGNNPPRPFWMDYLPVRLPNNPPPLRFRPRAVERRSQEFLRAQAPGAPTPTFTRREVQRRPETQRYHPRRNNAVTTAPDDETLGLTNAIAERFRPPKRPRPTVVSGASSNSTDDPPSNDDLTEIVVVDPNIGANTSFHEPPLTDANTSRNMVKLDDPNDYDFMNQDFIKNSAFERSTNPVQLSSIKPIHLLKRDYGCILCGAQVYEIMMGYNKRSYPYCCRKGKLLFNNANYQEINDATNNKWFNDSSLHTLKGALNSAFAPISLRNDINKALRQLKRGSSYTIAGELSAFSKFGTSIIDSLDYHKLCTPGSSRFDSKLAPYIDIFKDPLKKHCDVLTKLQSIHEFHHDLSNSDVPIPQNVLDSFQFKISDDGNGFAFVNTASKELLKNRLSPQIGVVYQKTKALNSRMYWVLPRTSSQRRYTSFNNRLSEINYIDLHDAYQICMYGFPLLFPNGILSVKLNPAVSRFSVYDKSPRAKMFGILHHRPGIMSEFIHSSGTLLDRCVATAWALIEQNQLNYISKKAYNNIPRGDLPQAVIKVPATVVGSKSYFNQKRQDLYAIGSKVGKSDLFITVTANQKAADLPNTSSYVYQTENYIAKHKLLVKYIKDSKCFGEVDVVCSTQEFQQRGNCHSHILIWLKKDDPNRITEDNIDDFISASFPHDRADPVNKKFVGLYTHNCSTYCLRTGLDGIPTCRFGYPMEQCPTARLSTSNRYIYARDEFSDRCVSHSKFLSALADCHVNVVFCSNYNVLPYLSKYVTKGEEVINASKIRSFKGETSNVKKNEILDYLYGRWVSTQAASMMLYNFKLFYCSSTVHRVCVHLDPNDSTNSDSLRDATVAVATAAYGSNVSTTDDDLLNIDDDDPEDSELISALSSSENAVTEMVVNKTSAFLKYFQFNIDHYDEVKHLNYLEFHYHYRYTSQGQWVKRTNPIPYDSTKDIFRWPLLFNAVSNYNALITMCKVTKCPRSYNDLRTVTGHTYETFLDAASAYYASLRGDIDTSPWTEFFKEAPNSFSNVYILKAFAMFLKLRTFIDPSSTKIYRQFIAPAIDPQLYKTLSQKYGRIGLRSKLDASCFITVGASEMLHPDLITAIHLSAIYQYSNKAKTADPFFDRSYNSFFEDILSQNENISHFLDYAKSVNLILLLKQEYNLRLPSAVLVPEMFKKDLNWLINSLALDQREAHTALKNFFNAPIQPFNKHFDYRNNNKHENIRYLNGIAGSGKSYLLNTLIKGLQLKKTLVVSSTGISSGLLISGRTAHSTFGIPVSSSQLDLGPSQEDIKKFKKSMKEIENIIFDEVSMFNAEALEFLNTLLNHVFLDMNNDTDYEDFELFGNRRVLFCGDDMQLLPVLTNSANLSGKEIIGRSIYGKTFYQKCLKVSLNDNRRLQDPENDSVNSYKKFLTQLRDPSFEEVQIPTCVSDKVHNDPTSFIYSVYEINKLKAILSHHNHDQILKDMVHYFHKTKLLSPKRRNVTDFNNKALDIFANELGQTQVSFTARDIFIEPSTDTIVDPTAEGISKVDDPVSSYFTPSVLKICKFCPLILNYNLNSSDLFNGTILVVSKISTHSVEVAYLAADNSLQKFLLPLIPVVDDTVSMPYTLVRYQLPVSLNFCETVHKSQGQTLDRFGIDISSPSFAHGQTYVAFSRASKVDEIFLFKMGDQNPSLHTEISEDEQREIDDADDGGDFLWIQNIAFDMSAGPD